MIGSTRMSYDVAQHRHQEHLSHAARIREIKQARRDGAMEVDRTAKRRLTAARLAGALATVKAALHF